MWNYDHHRHFPLPQPAAGAQPRLSKSAPCSPLKPLQQQQIKRAPVRADSFHVIHKVPVGDTPYVKAKHVQLVDKDPDRAIALFWAAINAGDRVDSALKDMAIVMKQQNRAEEAIEAIKSLRGRCSDHAQESLDNVLLDLYKRCGRLDDQIALLKHKLHLIHQGLAFNGRRTKTARCQGKKFQVSIEQEATRLLGNLGWAYMQQSNYVAAEAVYRKALSIEPDNNKVCNLGICLMKQGRIKEAKTLLKSVKPATADSPWGSDSHLKSYERAQQMLQELSGEDGEGEERPQKVSSSSSSSLLLLPDAVDTSINIGDWSSSSDDAAFPAKRWGSLTDADLSGALFATSGFGPTLPPLHHRNHHQLPPHSSKPAGGQHRRSSSLSGGSSLRRWEEEDAVQGFADENSSHGGSSMAEALRQKLEALAMAVNNNNAGTGSTNNNSKKAKLENTKLDMAGSNNVTSLPRDAAAIANSNQAHPPPLPSFNHQHAMTAAVSNGISDSYPPLPPPPPSAPPSRLGPLLAENTSSSTLNSAAPPFVAKSSSASTAPAKPQPLENRMPLTFDMANQQLKSLMATPDRGSKKSRFVKSLFSDMGAKKEEDDNSPDAWSRLGFIQGECSSPLCTIASLSERGGNNAKQQQQAISNSCQPPLRRLQVFQEMTTLPPSPQAQLA